MIDLSHLLSSKARFKVLKTLHGQPAPVHLRHIAALSRIPLFSAQRALNQLTYEKIIVRRKKGFHTLFALNPMHPCHPFLAGVFDLEMKERIRFLAKNYRQKALDALDFSASTNRFFEGFRRWI